MKKSENIERFRIYFTIVALISFMFSTIASSQTFDLLSASPSDKLAKSGLFYVDDNMYLNIFTVNSYSQPSSLFEGNLYEVPATTEKVSSVNNAAGAVANDFSLEQNFPNPFNPATTIRYKVGNASKVSLVLYDISGRIIRTLVNDEQIPGSHDVQWNGTNNDGISVASGTYFYRLIATNADGETHAETKRLTLLK